MPMNYNNAAIRKLIDAAFAGEDFDFFCYDHFREVHGKFTVGQSRPARIQLLIEYAETKGLMESLLEKLKEANPHQYNKFAPGIGPGESPPPEIERDEPSVDPDENKKPHGPEVFISYAREDIGDVKKLYEDLQKAGVLCWLDEVDLLPGQNWKTAISKAMKNCRYFMPVMSSKSLLKRGYVQKELRTALGMLDEFPQGDIFIIPVRLDDCRPDHEKLENIHFADLFPSYDAGLEKILKVLR